MRSSLKSTLLQRAAMAASVALAATLVGAPSAAADERSNGDAYSAYVEKHDHDMGSQIERVEGSDEEPSKREVAAQGDYGTRAVVYGIDVSGHQGNVDWNYWWNQGKRFAYVKATEGTSYRNPYFAQQYVGSYNVGMIRGAYHFALPDRSSGAAQANFLADHGGAWSADNQTLPAALDMEWNPYGPDCYGKSQSGMAAWIRDFHDTYHARTGRWPVIYTSTSWWNQCVGSAQSFGDTVPLWIARYNDAPGALPHGWSVWSFWQYSSSPIDQNSWNGSIDRLRVLANNG